MFIFFKASTEWVTAARGCFACGAISSAQVKNLLAAGALGEQVGVEGPVSLPEVVLPLHNGVQQLLRFLSFSMQGLGVLPEYLPVFAVRDGLHALDISKGVLEVKVKFSLGKAAENGVVDGLFFPVALVGMEGIAHSLGAGLAHVFERLLLVDTHQAAGASVTKFPPWLS